MTGAMLLDEALQALKKLNLSCRAESGQSLRRSNHQQHLSKESIKRSEVRTGSSQRIKRSQEYANIQSVMGSLALRRLYELWQSNMQ